MPAAAKRPSAERRSPSWEGQGVAPGGRPGRSSNPEPVRPRCEEYQIPAADRRRLAGQGRGGDRDQTPRHWLADTKPYQDRPASDTGSPTSSRSRRAKRRQSGAGRTVGETSFNPGAGAQWLAQVQGATRGDCRNPGRLRKDELAPRRASWGARHRGGLFSRSI